MLGLSSARVAGPLVRLKPRMASDCLMRLPTYFSNAGEEGKEARISRISVIDSRQAFSSGVAEDKAVMSLFKVFSMS